MMPKFSIFSSKKDGYSEHSVELCRVDLTGNEALVDEMAEHLRESGHKIVDCLEYEEQSSGKRKYRLREGNRR